MNTKIIPLLLALLTLPAFASTPQCVFANPLVTGASVSYGYGALPGGPSLVIAEMLNPLTEMELQAIPGATSVQILSLLRPSTPPSVIMAVDLFFWDAGRNECGADFVDSTTAFFREYKGTPMIIGKLPVGATFPQGIAQASASPCAPVINALLEKLCTNQNNCVLYNPLDCFNAMGNPAPYFIDALHTNHAGNVFCAQQFVNARVYEGLRCQ